MKKIKVIPPIQMVVPTKDGPVNLEMTMVRFLTDAMNNHAHFGKGFAGVTQGLKIKGVIDSAKDEIALEDVDYTELRKAVDGTAFHPVIAMACKMYYDAVEKPITQE